MKVEYVEVPGGRLYAEQAGSGAPLVFVHAGVTDSGLWDPQFAEFGGDRTLVRFDLRGFGRSVTEDVDFDPVDDIEAVFDHFGLERAVVVGASRGGQQSLDFTLAHPERVSGLVWVNGGVSGAVHEPSAEQTAVFDRIDALREAGRLDELVELETHVWADGPFQAADRAPAAVRDRLREWIRAIDTRDRPVGKALQRTDAVARLGELDIPVLVVIGAHDTSGTRASADLLVRRATRAVRLDFPDAAHLPSLEHAKRFNAALRDFLDHNSR